MSIFKNSETDFVPVQNETHYRILLQPRIAFQSVRRTTVDKKQGISYAYGLTESAVGGDGEVIEIWFERSKGWNALKVQNWMKKHARNLPVPTNARKAS